VAISTPQLGTLFNRVTTSDLAPPWCYGIRALMQDLAKRQHSPKPSAHALPMGFAPLA
jgi:fumarylacetoacetate (FAA) hydrolase family protein